MTKRRESEQQWERIVDRVGRCRKSLSLSLADAQQRFDAATELALSDLFVRSVVSQALDGRAEQLQTAVRHWLGNLLFSADTLARAEVGWVEPPHLVGAERDRLWIGVATVVQSDEVDAGRMDECWPGCTTALSPPSTEAVVYDVWADLHGLGHSEFRRVRQGTLLSDVYLDAASEAFWDVLRFNASPVHNQHLPDQAVELAQSMQRTQSHRVRGAQTRDTHT